MKTHHRIVPIILIVLGIPFALAAAFLITVNLAWHDEQPPNDSMLALPIVRLAESDNAYILVNKLSQDISTADPAMIDTTTDDRVDAMLNGGAWDEAYAASVTKKFATAITDLHVASAIERYQDPNLADPSTIDQNTPFSSIGQVRLVGKLVVLQALKKARAGNMTNALTETMDVVRLGHLMELGRGTIIQYLVGSAVKQIGLAGLRQIALTSALTVDQAKSVAQELEAYRDSRAGEVLAFKLEYAYFKPYLPQMQHLDEMWGMYNLSSPVSYNGASQHNLASRLVPTAYAATTDTQLTTPMTPTTWFITALDYSGIMKFYYWPNQTWRFAIEKTQQEIAWASQDCQTVQNNVQLPRMIGDFSVKYLFTPNVIGKMLHDIGLVSLSGLSTKRCNESVAISATQVALATSAYAKAAGHAPESLTALAPAYLSSVPIDPYNGQPIKYVLASKLVYTVGPKRVDVGGSPVSTDWQNLDNPSFTISR